MSFLLIFQCEMVLLFLMVLLFWLPNSGAISFEEGVKLVQKRGEYMQNLLPKGNWQMSAVMGLTDEQVEEVCKKVKSGFVVPAFK